MAAVTRIDRARIPWPTVDQLEHMGFIRCQGDPDCTTFIDPANVPSKRCTRHRTRPKAARMPYIAREQLRAVA
jgi:hypothetical protein